MPLGVAKQDKTNKQTFEQKAEDGHRGRVAGAQALGSLHGQQDVAGGV